MDELNARIAAFLDGATDRFPSEEVPPVPAAAAKRLARQVREVDWFLAFRPGRSRPVAASTVAASASADAAETIAHAAAHVQPTDSVAVDMMHDAVKWALRQIMTEPGGAEKFAGLDARESTVRRQLARSVAVRVWGGDRLPRQRAQLYWSTVAAAIRGMLRQRIEAQQATIPAVESEGVDDRTVTALATSKVDWLAVDDRWQAGYAANPLAADVFALRHFAGLGWDDIVELVGGEKDELMRQHLLLEHGLLAVAR